MTRMSKKARRRHISPKRRRLPGIKTGPKKDAIPFRAHPNAAAGDLASKMFIGMVS